uniref:Ig-like domain-containing protein n=1 Tax=Leptobrachium leishanense TaxID=445787 RepID=A0A8C5RAG7_9ANUR
MRGGETDGSVTFGPRCLYRGGQWSHLLEKQTSMKERQLWGSESIQLLGWSWVGTAGPLHILLTGGCRFWCIHHLWLLPWTLTDIGAVKVTVNTPSVLVTRGGSALLPCYFRTTAALNRLNIIWTVSPLMDPLSPLQVISYEQGQIVDSLSDYLGRVRFAFHPTKDASIIINQTRSSDTGTYQCTVINPPDGATPNIGLIGLTVLVPPSAPQCSSEGQRQEGGSIRLHCSAEEGVPAPRFTWGKIPPDNHVLVTHQEAVLGIMGIVTGITITMVMGLVLLALFALVLCLHQQSRGKWIEQKEEMHHQIKMDTLSPEYLTKTSSTDHVPLNRTTKPLWVLSSQAGKPPTHVLYDIRQSQASLSPAYMPARNLERDLATESSSDDDYYSTPELTPIHPTNSGFLV